MSTALCDEQGQFEIKLSGTGAGTVSAMKPGYQQPTPVSFEITDEGTAPPPMTLVLTRESTVRGMVVSAAGAPVAGALVVSAAVGDLSSSGETRTDPAGRFEVAVPPGPAYLFLSGPGCPMFAADLAGASSAPPPAAMPAPAGGAGGADAAAAVDSTGGAGGADAANGPDAAAGTAQVWQCPAEAGAIALTLVESGGKPATPRSLGFKLRRNGVLVPLFFLLEHQALLGLPNQTDAAGQLLLGNLSPGQYDFVLDFAPRDSGAAGSVAVQPGITAPLTLTMPARYLRRP